MDMLMKVLPYIINIMSGCILAVCTYNITKMRSDREEAKNKEQAIENGVQCLLRDSIVSAYNKYSSKGYCPIYAKETVKRSFKAYAALGGNDVAKELYHKILAMQEEPEEEDKQ